MMTAEQAKKRAAYATALAEARQKDGGLHLTGCQLALLLRAAQEVLIQDPETSWLPEEFEEDLLGALLRIDALAHFAEPIHVEVNDAFHRMAKRGQE